MLGELGVLKGLLEGVLEGVLGVLGVLEELSPSSLLPPSPQVSQVLRAWIQMGLHPVLPRHGFISIWIVFISAPEHVRQRMDGPDGPPPVKRGSHSMPDMASPEPRLSRVRSSRGKGEGKAEGSGGERRGGKGETGDGDGDRDGEGRREKGEGRREKGEGRRCFTYAACAACAAGGVPCTLRSMRIFHFPFGNWPCRNFHVG